MYWRDALPEGIGRIWPEGPAITVVAIKPLAAATKRNASRDFMGFSVLGFNRETQ